MRNVLNPDPLKNLTDDDLGPLLDVNFLINIVLVVTLVFFAQKNWRNRSAVPHTGANGSIRVSEEDYQRLITVRIDEAGEIALNEKPVSEAELVPMLVTLTQDSREEKPQVVFQAAPTLPHGRVVELREALRSADWTLLEELEENPNPKETD